MFDGFEWEDGFQELDEVVLFLVGEGGAEEGEGDEVGFRVTGYGLSLTRIRTNIRSFALLRMTVFKSRFAVVCTTGFTVAAAVFV